MRVPALFASLLLFCGTAIAGGTVSFNVKWYATQQFPVVDYNHPVTTGVVIADFNRDGIPDVAYNFPGCDPNVASCAAVIVKLGTGSGNLGPDVSYPFGENGLSELAAVDIDGDGWLDIVFEDIVDGIGWLANNGDGTFRLATKLFANGRNPGSFTMGDFNHDGKIDMAVIACDAYNGGFPFGSDCSLYVLNNGPGGFAQTQIIQLMQGSSALDLQSADINGDGNLDLIFVRGSVGVILWGRGDGTFSGTTYLKPATTEPMDAVAVADFNNDGRLDIALLSGDSCRPNPQTGTCAPNPNTVWMYKNNGGTNFTLTTHTQFTAQAGAIVPADINGDLNQDLLHFNPFASGIDPVLGAAGGFQYVPGLGNDTLGTQGTLPGATISAAVFRDINGDSRADYAVIDWSTSQLGIGIQAGGYKNCPPPSSAHIVAKICGISNGTTVSSPLLVKAAGNSPAGVNQLQVWIDGKKQYVKWGDQLAKKFALSSGKHRIAIVAADKYVGQATTAVTVTVP